MTSHKPEPSGFTEEIMFPEVEPLGHLGRYELLALLGEGGMASVFLARLRGPSGFEKILALKRIKPSLSEDPRLIDMFLDEARVAGLLRHPNIAQVFELDHDGPIYFLAMEYLHGEHLGSVLKRAIDSGEQLPVALTCWIGARIAEALDHAHDARDAAGRRLSIVHRDVSPQNIFVTYGGEVKLTDFGVAKASSNTTETDTGVVKGKFAYMAPEQALAQGVDRRVDVFALGAVLWEALAGQRLFFASTDAQTILNITRCEVPSLLTKRPEVGRPLDGVVRRALALEPSERFATAGALGRALSDLSVGVSSDDLRAWMTSHFARAEERGGQSIVDASDIHTKHLDVGDPHAAVATDTAASTRRSRGIVALVAVVAVVALCALGVFAAFAWTRSSSEVAPNADTEVAPTSRSRARTKLGSDAPSASIGAPSDRADHAIDANTVPLTDEEIDVDGGEAPPPRVLEPPDEATETHTSHAHSQRAEAAPTEVVSTGRLEISIAPAHRGARYGWASVGDDRRALPTVIEVAVGATWVRYQLGEEPEQRVRVRVARNRVTTLQLPR